MGPCSHHSVDPWVVKAPVAVDVSLLCSQLSVCTLPF